MDCVENWAELCYNGSGGQHGIMDEDGSNEDNVATSILTPEQVRQIDRHVRDVCHHGFGRVVLVVLKGKLRFIEPSQSIKVAAE